MNKFAWRVLAVVGTAMILAGCGNKETQEALDKSRALRDQKQYSDANKVLVDALKAREDKVRAAAGMPVDSTGADALHKKIQADSEFLKLERAQIPLYLQMGRADLAYVVYADVLAGNPGDHAVYDTLGDKDPTIRAGAVHVLGLMAQPDAVNALATATHDSDQEVRRTAVASLGAIKDPGTVPPLVDALKDSFWFARTEAAEALGQKQDERAVKPLIDAIGDTDGTVRSSAEAALIQLSRQPGAVAKPDDFSPRLQDPNPMVVTVSAICLALLKDPRAVPVLSKLVTSTDPTVRLEAVKGLGETGDPSVIPILRGTLKDPDINMRGWSILGLGTLKDEDSIMDLQDIALDEKEPATIRAAASASVMKIKSSTGAENTP